MPKSMTGFGRGEAAGCGKKFTVELKSVNHRYAEVVLRMPKQLFSMEEKARRVVLQRLARGRIDGFVNMDQTAERITTVTVDKALASSYYNAMREVQALLCLQDHVKSEYVFSLPGVMTLEEPVENNEEWWPVLEQAFNMALDRLMEMRSTEGNRLEEDLRARLKSIYGLVAGIEVRVPAVVDDYRSRLSHKLSEWLDGSILDMNRVMAEVTIFAERSNITEEIVRLRSHINQALESLDNFAPVGRKLDFIVQEMNREINTIASKSGDILIAGIVVEVKSELEKIREQVQNLE